MCAHKANKSQQSCLITQRIDHFICGNNQKISPLVTMRYCPGNPARLRMPAAIVPALHQSFVFELCLSSQLNQCLRLHSCRNLICKNLSKSDGNNRALSCSFSILSNSCFIKSSLHVLCLHGCWNPSQILLRWILTVVPGWSASKLTPARRAAQSPATCTLAAI